MIRKSFFKHCPLALTLARHPQLLSANESGNANTDHLHSCRRIQQLHRYPQGGFGDADGTPTATPTPRPTSSSVASADAVAATDAAPTAAPHRLHRF